MKTLFNITEKELDKITQRFWEKVLIKSEDECWEWLAYRENFGHGRFQLFNKAVPAHRVAYQLINGEISNDLVVRHACNFPPCCNPRHLVLGTYKDNAEDMVKSGRHVKRGKGAAIDFRLNPKPEIRKWKNWHIGERTDTVDRFLSKIDITTNQCWIWKGSTNVKGTPIIAKGKNNISALKFSFEKYKEKIPNRSILKQTCKNSLCVNPEHLQITSSAEKNSMSSEILFNLTEEELNSLKTRFWNKVSKSDNCWKWKGAKSKSGYGNLAVSKKYITVGATRISYFLHFGAFNTSLLLCHKCDNPSCVNPEHLFLGTVQDNSTDMMKKGRSASGDKNTSRKNPEKVCRGLKNGNSKISIEVIEKVFQLKSKQLPNTEIGKMINIAPLVVGRILLGKTYTEESKAFEDLLENKEYVPNKKAKNAKLGATDIEYIKLLKLSGVNKRKISMLMRVTPMTIQYTLRQEQKTNDNSKEVIK